MRKSSAVCASSRVLPVSATIVCTTRWRFSTNQRRISRNTSARPSKPSASQPGCAMRARFASPATSASAKSGTCPIVSPVAGFSTAIVAAPPPFCAALDSCSTVAMPTSLNPRARPLRERRHYLLRRVLADVVTGALERDRAVVRERRLPALAFARPERLIARRPHDERGAIVERGEAAFDLPKPRRLTDDRAREHVHRHARFGCRERAAVVIHHALVRPDLLGPRGDDLLDEEVAPLDQVAADRATEERAEDARAAVVGHRPRPRVADRERGEALERARRRREADRPAPVLNEQRRVAQVELLDERLDHACVGWRPEVVPGRRRREPEAGQIHGDAAVAIAHALDHVAPRERPR